MVSALVSSIAAVGIFGCGWDCGWRSCSPCYSPCYSYCAPAVCSPCEPACAPACPPSSKVFCGEWPREDGWAFTVTYRYRGVDPDQDGIYKSVGGVWTVWEAKMVVEQQRHQWGRVADFKDPQAAKDYVTWRSGGPPPGPEPPPEPIGAVMRGFEREADILWASL